MVLDTSGLLAALFSDQRRHEECVRVLRQADSPLLLSPFVLAELDYLILKFAGVGPELRLLEEVTRGAYRLEPFGSRDLAEAAKIIERHRDLQLGLADASIVVLAGRFKTRRILTLDERHFRSLLGPGGQPFQLLPADA